MNASTSIDVRVAVLADLDEVARLFDLYRQFQGQPADLAGARRFLQARFHNAESIVFLAHQGSAPVGFAQLYPSFSSTSLGRVFILNDLYVSRPGRRKGVASRLLAAVESYAWSQHAVRVTLNVARDNVAGQALYEARGWTQDQQFFMYHRFPDNPRPA